MSIKVESATDTVENVAAANAVVPPVEEKVETKENDQDEPEELVADVADADETDDDDQEEVEPEDKPKKKKSGYVRKLEKKDELIAAKDREIELLKQLAEKGNPKDKAEPKKVADSSAKPNPDNFESHSEYVEALTEWKIEQKEQLKTQEKAENEAKQKAKEVGQAFKERLETFKEKHEDFDDLLEAATKPNLRLDEAAQHALIESEKSAEMLYELAKNIPELERISKLSPIQQIKELGKIEARLTSEPVKEPKKQSTAPAPISPIKAKGATVTKSIYDPNLSQAEYEALRRKQKAGKTA